MNALRTPSPLQFTHGPRLPRMKMRPPGCVMHADTTGEDALLMAAISGGSEDALRQLYERYGRLSYTLALRIVGDSLLAQEVVQDVFLRCWERSERFEASRGRVPAWLMGVTRNRSIDALRVANRRPRTAELVEQSAGFNGHAPSTDGEIESVALQLSVADALQSLPVGQRQAIDLVLSGGLTQREISELLGLPLGTVKTRIRDGMARLRLHLAAGPGRKDVR